MDTASLRIAINTGDVKTANQELDKLAKTAGNTEKATNNVSSSFLSLNKVLAVGTVAAVASQFIKLADTMTGVNSKLKLVTSSTQELASVQNELFRIAQTTRQGFAETVDTYSNFAVAMGQMGKSQKEVLRTVETINKAIAVSGGTAQQAAAATMQLGQAFASGTLRGDELNSILENSKGLAQAIADGMGVPIGKLRELGSEGKITADILAKALEKSAQSVDEKFSKVGITVEQSMTLMENSLMKAVSEMDNATGASSALANAISALSGVFSSAADSLHRFNIEITRLQDVRKIKNLDDANIALKQIDDEIKSLTTSMDLSDRIKRNLMGEVNVRAKLIQLKAAEASLNKKVNVIAEEEVKIQEKRIQSASKTTTAKTEKTKKTEAQKQAEKLEEDIAKAKRNAMENNAEREAELYLGVYKAQQDAIQTNYDNQAQLAIDVYQSELDAIEYNAARQAELALMFYDMTLSESDRVNAKFLEIFEANNGLFSAEQMDTFFNRWNEQLENTRSGYNSLIDEIDSLAASSKDWTAGLTGQAKVVANILNASLDLASNEKKFAKEREKIAKSNLTSNEKEIASEKLKTVETEAQYAAYSNLAGAMAGAFEQGSEGAIAFTALQSALGIASSWTAIANAWALPFPANIPAVAAVTGAVLPIIAQLGGSSGGGGSGSMPSQFEQNRAMIETTYAPMTDRLDRQIELLESIDRNGSAAQLGVQLAGTSFQRDYLKWVEDLLESSRLSAATGRSAEEVSMLIGQIESRAGVDIYDISGDGGAISLNTSILRQGFNAINAVLATLQTGGYGTFGQGDITNWGDSAEAYQQMMGSIRGSVNELQNIIQDWAMGVVESMDDLKDASKDFKGYFDDVTGSMFYESQRLSKAFSDIDMLRGENSFAEYLQNNITKIDALQKFFTDETFSLLMSDSLDNIQAQISAIEELSAITGQTFEGGAREALNYLESIQLVSEAMATSRNNIESFVESLRTSEQSAQYLASSLGVSLASNVDELASLFEKLRSDTEGLTDSDLELLNANKALLENTDQYQTQIDDLNDSLSDTTSKISTLNNVFTTITSTIEKLRGASRTSEQNLQVFYDAMAEAQRLSKTDDYAGYAEAVKKAADTSSALFNKDNFALTRDMEYAQLVAANQFEELSTDTMEQIDYLKQIELNTRTQIDVLVEAMNALGASISEALKQKITGQTLIEKAYQTVLGREADMDGANYWQGQVASGAISSTGIGVAIGAAGVENREISRADYVTQLYTQGLGRTPTQAEIDYWAKDSQTPTTQLASLFSQIDPNFQSFAVGTPNVPYDMLANIHKGETIVPAPFAEGLRNGTMMMGNQNALINELRTSNNLLNGIIVKQNEQISVLLESRDVQNGSLEVLERMEVIL